MPTKGEGAIGALDFTPEERKKLAKEVNIQDEMLISSWLNVSKSCSLFNGLVLLVEILQG